MEAALKGVGLKVLELQRALREEHRGVAVITSFPYDYDEAKEKAEEILDEVDPSAVIAVEKAGRSIKGEYHNMKGLNVSPHHVKVEPLVEEARRRDIITVGVGDGGNEVGMGKIAETVKKNVP